MMTHENKTLEESDVTLPPSLVKEIKKEAARNTANEELGSVYTWLELLETAYAAYKIHDIVKHKKYEHHEELIEEITEIATTLALAAGFFWITTSSETKSLIEEYKEQYPHAEEHKPYPETLDKKGQILSNLQSACASVACIPIFTAAIDKLVISPLREGDTSVADKLNDMAEHFPKPELFNSASSLLGAAIAAAGFFSFIKPQIEKIHLQDLNEKVDHINAIRQEISYVKRVEAEREADEKNAEQGMAIHK